MKIYFDNLNPQESNLKDLQKNNDQNYWLVSEGTILKTHLHKIGYRIDLISQYTDPGCYFIDLNADPVWWSGLAEGTQVPTSHVLRCLPDDIIQMVRFKKIRLILAADKEGGSMISDNHDSFLATTDAMIDMNFPPDSVLIIQGNKKIESDYEGWLIKTQNPRMFKVQYSSHFTNLFYDKNFSNDLSIDYAIENAIYDFNSLNRVYRSHRGAHCHFLLKNNLLKNGMISCNQIVENDPYGAQLSDTSNDEFIKTLKGNFPLFLDGDWSQENAAEKHNLGFYKNSLMSFITETKFEEDVVFPTEKIFKPITFGHPLILLSSRGTLQLLKEMGFVVDWCGIDPSYNNIEDHKERFIETHNILKWWVSLDRKDKINRIKKSRDAIEHNFKLIRSTDFYSEGLKKIIKDTESYFND